MTADLADSRGFFFLIFYLEFIRGNPLNRRYLRETNLLFETP
jgi:hypothetical protein